MRRSWGVFVSSSSSVAEASAGPPGAPAAAYSLRSKSLKRGRKKKKRHRPFKKGRVSRQNEMAGTWKRRCGYELGCRCEPSVGQGPESPHAT